MKFFKNKKGQAALEFLTTYGWAFLVILIMIGALAYFGVLSPRNLLPERCTFPAGLECIDYVVTEGAAAGQLTAQLQLKSINDDALSAASMEVLPEEGAGPNLFNCAALTVPIGTSQEFTVTCTDIPGTGFGPQGDKQKLIMRFNYTESGGSFGHSLKGEVMATIQ